MNTELIKERCIASLPELQAACIEYIAAKTIEETVIDKAKEIQKQVLTEHEYYVNEAKAAEINEAARQGGFTEDIQEIERITDEFDTYLMSAEDAQDYYNRCYECYVKAGIADERGALYCPEAAPKENRFAAEKKVLDIMEKITADFFEPQDFKYAKCNVKYKEQILKIAVGLAMMQEEEAEA